MTEKDNTRDLSIRSAAIELAIKSNCGQAYDTDGKVVYNADDIVSAAKKFEDFIKGNNLPTNKRKKNW